MLVLTVQERDAPRDSVTGRRLIGRDRRVSWLRIRLILWMVFGAVAAVIVGFGVALVTAMISTEPAVFLSMGVAAGAVAWWALVRRWVGRLEQRRRTAVHAVAAMAGAVLVISVLAPLGDPVTRSTPPPGAGTWTLPDGTHLAYGVVRAQHATAAPVVILHGGPGVPDLVAQLAALAELTKDGHDVYAYAQVGAGASSRLSDPRDYTVDRAMADLEFVRQQIGASEMILVGHSYGAYLAAVYLARHPGRVERVVFSSPGDLDDGLSGAAIQARLTYGERRRTYSLLAPPRALLAYALVQVNPASAHAFAGDREVDARMDRVYAATLPALRCPGDEEATLRESGVHQLGFYVHQVPQSLQRPPAPEVRSHLHTVRAPALVIKGQCDYLDWQSAVDYLQALPDTRLTYIHGAGHDIHVSRPNDYLGAIRAFLAGDDVPGLVPEPRKQPADYLTSVS